MSDKLVVQGVSKNVSEKELYDAIKNVFLKSTNNLSWLNKGDIVLLKPALNSPDPYPSTTHPLSIKVVHDVLKQRGAKVITADQSGIEHVLQDSSGIQKGSSKDCFEKSGMFQSEVEFTEIEKRGWNSFYKFDSPSWKNGFYISDLIKKADHIINLPRLSTHSQAGVTLGFKSMIGLLREDSRLEFHADGPFWNILKSYAKKSNLKKNYSNENLFFEKMTEISLALKEKLRLTLFTGTQAQTTFGPDKYILSIFKSHVSKPQTGLIFASSNQIATESFAISFLKILYKNIPFYDKIIQKLLIKINGQIKDLEKEKVWENPFIKNALKLRLGKKEYSTEYIDIPNELKIEIEKILSED